MKALLMPDAGKLVYAALAIFVGPKLIRMVRG